MKATVKYDNDGQPSRVIVKEVEYGHRLKFKIDGSSAVLVKVEPGDGADVYFDRISRVMDYVESLPFVQAVTLDEHTEEEQ